MNKIQIKNITKKYNNLTALDDVSFSFEFGKIYGLLGRNGAGKSTLTALIMYYSPALSSPKIDSLSVDKYQFSTKP